jgi:hypothetical protein
MLLVACAPGVSHVPCPKPDTEAAVFPEDTALRRWKAIVEDDARPPAAPAAAALVPELVAYLGSPDPVRRDLVAYTVLDQWIRRRVLSDADVRALANQLVDNLRDAIDVPDGVFRRSFSALVLASIVARDVTAGLLADGQRRAILAAAHHYAHRETDLRGHTATRGWVHAAAHTGDLLAELAAVPGLSDGERAVILDAVAGFVVRKHGQILRDGEDGRLAAAVIAAARHGVAPDALAAWIRTIEAAIRSPSTMTFDQGAYAARLNAHNLLSSVLVQVSLAREPSDGERQLLEAVRAALLAET